MPERPAAPDGGTRRGRGVVIAVGSIVAGAVLVVYLAKIAPGNALGAIVALGLLVVLLALALLIDGRDVRAGHARGSVDEGRLESDAAAIREAALRRVATLVAQEADPTDVYAVGVAEVACGLGVEHVMLIGFDAGSSCTVHAVHAVHDGPGGSATALTERLSIDGDPIADGLRRTGMPARFDACADADGPIASRMRARGVATVVGSPIVVAGESRGALIVGSVRPGPVPSLAEERIGEFADLVALAIANAEARAELAASRARLVSAADDTRRRIERDLRDGPQQRIIALGDGLRTVEASVSPDEQAVRLQLDNVINGLADLYREVQDVARGIYPATLTTRGLGPALRTLARRSAVPVRIDVAVDRRLPESVEITAYHVVAEALVNAAKHSRASVVTIHVELRPAELRIEIVDDGVGGASSADGGAGLIGLRDRVEAVSGRLEVSSPRDGGTTVTALIPHAQRASPA